MKNTGWLEHAVVAAIVFMAMLVLFVGFYHLSKLISGGEN